MTRIYVPCETTACALGADAVAAVIAQRIEAGAIHATLTRNGSRGAFFLEPLVEIETADGRIGFANLTDTEAAALFTGPALPDAAHPRCLGRVDALPWLAQQTRLTFAHIGMDDPLSFAAWQARGGGAALRAARAQSPTDTITQLQTSGLRGRGGAAFPASIKWQTVRDTPASQKYIVCNADEGDSGTFADRLLMECDPFQLIEGMAVAGLVVGASKGYVYVRSEYPRAIEVMRAALRIAEHEGLVHPDTRSTTGTQTGQFSEEKFSIELRVGAGAYVCGEETALLESIEGKRGVVRRKPPVPAVAGLFGQPTLVHNVLTLAAVTQILAQGAAHYAAHGCGRSRGTMPFQLGGVFATGGLVEVPFGLPLRELVSRFGGGSDSGHPLAALQIGGPLGAYLPPGTWDVPLDYEAFAAIGAMLGHGGVVAFDNRVNMAAQAEFAMRFCALESCGKCTPCRIGSTRGAELIQSMRTRPQAAQRVLLDDLLETMELGSLCALGGLTPMPVRSILTNFPDAFDPILQRPDTSASTC